MRAMFYGLALAATGLAAPASAEVVQSAENGFVIRFNGQVPAGSEDVWKQLMRPADWWSSAHTYSGDAANLWLDGQATGCFCEKLPLAKNAPEGMRPGSAEHLRVVYVEPGRAIRMVGGLGPLQSDAVAGVMTISLKAGNGGTRIALEYAVSGFLKLKSAEMAPAVDKVLGEQFKRLTDKFAPAAAAAAESGAEAPAKEAPPKSGE